MAKQKRTCGAGPASPFSGTERTGFEPVIGFYPYTGLANRRYRPLSHLSKHHHKSRLPKTLSIPALCKGVGRPDIHSTAAPEPSKPGGPYAEPSRVGRGYGVFSEAAPGSSVDPRGCEPPLAERSGTCAHVKRIRP